MKEDFGVLEETVLARLSRGILSNFDSNFHGPAKFSARPTHTIPQPVLTLLFFFIADLIIRNAVVKFEFLMLYFEDVTRHSGPLGRD